MAIGWLSVLRSVPWAEVVNNAPKVASGAKKLWSAVGAKTPQVPPAATPAPVDLAAAEGQNLLALQSRIAELEAAAADLHSQMMDSSALVKALAEQNTQLILRTDTLRKRLAWVAGLLGVTALLAAGGLVLRFVG
jgi:hypothetical protein